LSDIYLAIDIGTTNVKIGVFNRFGQMVYLDQKRCIESTTNGSNEIDPSVWWKTVSEMLVILPNELKEN